MKQIVVTLSVDENVILGEAGHELLEDAITQELGWLHDSGMFVDGWQFAAPEKTGIDKVCSVELEMVNLLVACDALSDEHDMNAEYGETIFEFIYGADACMVPKFFEFLRHNLEDFEKALTINKTLILTGGCEIKDILDALSNTAIDCLYDDLVNVINESEISGLSSERQDYLDNRYLEITTARSRFEELVNTPGFTQEISLGDKLKSAAERAGAPATLDKESIDKTENGFEH